MTRRTYPVQTKGQRSPAGLRTQFFLAHIVCPATAGLTDTTTHHQHIDEAAVVHIHVVPVVQRCAHNHHGTTTGFVGITGEFTGNPDHISTVYTGNHFLPEIGRAHV